MSEMTLAELAREQIRLERRFADTVSRQVYEQAIGDIRNDIAEIKDSLRWAMRLIAGEFVALIVALLLVFVQNLPNL